MAWCAVLLLKALVAARLPLFADEAFYWQEGQHLAWAYAEVPGMTAWLARLGVAVGGNTLAGLRWPFLLLGAALPWLVVRMAAAVGGSRAGWQAGGLALLMPLSAGLGLLAVPDVPLVVASVACLQATVALLQRITPARLAWLAVGLVAGALSHYRFLGFLVVWLGVLAWLPAGRDLLRDRRLLPVLAAAVLAWLPLLALAMALACARAAPVRNAAPVRLLALAGGATVLLLFLLGFLADAERVSFHWPLTGLLALLALVPGVLAGWSGPWRRLAWAGAGIGGGLVMAVLLLAGLPEARSHLAGSKWYPRNFGLWPALAATVERELAAMPPGTRLLADSFKTGAGLGFSLGRADIAVLPHVLNDRHGRTPQLAAWGLLETGAGAGPWLLVLDPAGRRFRELLDHYHALCRQLGPLPPPRTLGLEHGSQRFLLFRLAPGRAPGTCVTPALAWVDAPLPDAVVAGGPLAVAGWAFKDGVGLSRVEVLVDGRPAAVADYGLPVEVRHVWPASTDPSHPRVGWRATVEAPALVPGRHWLGLRLHGRDGSVEDWSELPVRVEPEAARATDAAQPPEPAGGPAGGH